MYLKQLEMQGFKSFPEKIRLKFGSGITAVVGPNGSGKSNVADAVRWVLGEASTKNLRGQKMEDVIFAGTQSRKPLGFAEVSLVLDNTDGKLNLDYAEVTVTRRLYRSGESAYLINGAPCRRRDIIELFMDTGVGKEGYSIIGQGRIDEILSVKSEDRRMLFEEAAGIVKYKARRNEAQKKLENEHGNLLRAEDIISEIEGRLAPLEKAAEKAKQYLDLSDELKHTDISIFVLDVKRYEEQTKKLNEGIEGLINQIEQTERLLEESESKKALQKESSDRINGEIEELNGRLTDLKVNYQEKLNDISLLKNRIEHTEKDIFRIGSDKELFTKSIEEKTAEIEKKKALLENKRSELEEINKKELALDSEYNEKKSRLEKKESELEDCNKGIMDIMEKSSNVKEEIAKAEGKLNSINAQKIRIENDITQNKNALAEKQGLLAELKSEEDNIRSLITSQNEAYRSILEERQGLNKKNDSLLKAHRDIITRLNERKSRIHILTELESSYEGYYGGVKAVLKMRDRQNELKGICGAVGELISTEKKYELAVETALGGSLQSIITEDEEAAKAAIAYLKRTGSGRATFMPITAVRQGQRALGSEVTSGTGFIGSAMELIKCDGRYAGVLNGLLGRVAVVDNIDNGIALARKIRYSVKIVTLTGEVFNPGGSMTGGSSAKKSAGIISRKGELKKLEQEAAELTKRQEQAGRELEELSQRLEELNNSAEAIRQSCSSENMRLSAVSAKINGEKESAEDLKKRLNELNDEYTLLLADEVYTNKSFDDMGKSLKDIEKEITESEERLNAYREENAAARQELDGSFRRITEIKLTAERVSSEILAEERDVERLTGEIEDIKNSANEGEKDVIKLKDEINAAKAEIDAKTKDAHETNGSIDILTEEYNSRLRERYDINGIIGGIEEEIKEHNDILINLNGDKAKHDERLAALKEKCRALYDNMWEAYEMTYPEAVRLARPNMPAAELHKRAKELRSSIKALGSINTSAPEEYREAKERYEFLTSQRNDILKAEEDLREIIDRLEERMREQFTSRFSVINENFKKVFKVMFGGGQANIRLSDEKDVLNSGIEINAQPPGKKLQSMLLLSGGEKALTAMALLFAILQMKPSPFCILDEIEAALDDANVSRYAKYIKHLSETTQFIVITHRKGTMEEADTLYGITMQEQGISKMVSVSLKEADELTEKEK